MTQALRRNARADIHLALQARGFRQTRLERGAPVYEGEVRSGRQRVPIALRLVDPLMTEAPWVFVTDPAVRASIGAHLAEDGRLCYIETSLEEYDPYDGGGAILRCLESVKETLTLVLHGNPRTDLVREFPAYWDTGLPAYLDLPSGFAGRAVVMKRKPAHGDGVLITTPARRKLWGSRLETKPINEAIVVVAAAPFIADRAQRPGGTAATFQAWARAFVAPETFDKAYAAAIGEDCLLVATAPNGAIGVRFVWPTLFTKAFKAAPAGRRKAWLMAHLDRLEVKRMSMAPIDLESVVDARLAAPSPLKALTIAVIGCGAIGGRVALDLARSGAGTGEAALVLVDPDVLKAENLGRHVLGVDAVGQFKAQALVKELQRFHPSVSATAIIRPVQDVLDRVARCDLIIDATGHNPLALRLNAEAVGRRRASRPFPPVIHAAIHGNGLAVQTILVDDDAHACFKCLRPEHGRFKANPLKPGQQTNLAIAACGDGAHVPYAAAAPAMAAALTLLAATEWAFAPDRPGPRVRTRRLNLERTENLQDKSHGPNDDCPACRAVSADDDA